MQRRPITIVARSRFSTAIASLVVGAGSLSAFADDPLAFTEEALQRGVNYPLEIRETFGTGIAFADLNNDGDVDLVTMGKRGDGGALWNIGVYENLGSGQFLDRSRNTGIPPLPASSGVTAADYDGDGDLDLHISCVLAAHCLMRNDGNFTFTDVAAQVGVADLGAGQGCGWADFDNDGWLDLYVGNRTGTNHPEPPFTPSPIQNRLYRNLGGTFVDVAPALGVASGLDPTFQASFFDFDRDGDADIYLSTDKGLSTGCMWRNRMFRNNGGTFTDISAASGTDGCIDAMTVTLGDFDNNQFQDIYVTNLPAGNPLYLNNGDGTTFTEYSVPAGVITNEVSWGAAFFDYDNDTHLDLYVCNMVVPESLYDYNGTWPATNVAAALGVGGPNDAAETFCVASADIDNDGDIDFAVSARRSAVEGSTSRLRLYVNHEGERRNWAKFRVIGTGHNTWGVGTNIDVRAGTVRRIREVIAGCNFKSQNDLVQHFGLADATRMDEIIVKWPGGVTRTLRNLSANQHWTLYPPSRLGDVNGDAVVNAADFPTLVACFTGAVPGALSPGCEMMDLDGDGDVDAADIDGFLALYVGTQADCDGSGTPDLAEIASGASPDLNSNLAMDFCEGLGDLNCDAKLNFFDIDPFLTAIFDPTGYGQQYGDCQIVRGDTNGDAAIGLMDVENFVQLLFWE